MLPALLLLGTSVLAQDTYLVKDARIVTVSGPVIEKGDILLQGGLIREIGTGLRPPPGATVISAAGLTAYPGLFDANTTVGMQSANERTMGELTPHLQVFASFDLDDEQVEIDRAAGITHVLARPWQRRTGAGRLRAGILPGQAAVMKLRGWTPQEMAVRRAAGVVLAFPGVGDIEYSDDERYVITPWSETRKLRDKTLQELRRFFADAREYGRRKEALSAEEARRFSPDRRFEAMLPVFAGEQPLLIDVDNDVDIRSAVEFGRAERVKYVLLGAQQAWKVADFLKESGARLILTGLYRGPIEDDDPVDILDRTPALLHEKGIPFAISAFDAIRSDLLPYQAGTAVGHGLPWAAAVRSITLTPAEILGVADKLGSLEVGKLANVVLADGDILEAQTRIKHVFIDGTPVPLDTRDTRLYEAYRNRH
jgi:imidazolonepropionase-like amidohydrolase